MISKRMGCPCCKKKAPEKDEAYVNMPMGPVTVHYDNETGGNVEMDEALKEKVKDAYHQVEEGVIKATNDAETYLKSK